MRSLGFQPHKNQKGSLAVDFIFSFTLACLLSMMILAITATFTVVEVAQYIAFSGARAMAGADSDIASQKASAQAKITALLANPAFKPFFSTTNNWFALTLKDIKTGGKTNLGGDGADYSGEYDSHSFGPGQFIPQVGLRLNFEAKILHFNIAFLGSTNNNNGAGYNAAVTGFLIREPTQKECQALMNQQKIINSVRTLDGRYTTPAISFFPGNAALPLEDNGC